MEGADSGLLPKKRRANLKEGDLDPRISKALNFHDAILADLHDVEPVEGEQGVIFGVMRDVPDSYTGKTRNIVVRDADNGFWNALLNEAEQENTSTRFAVVGSPGIGKSTTVAFAIRLLLLQEKTVVYKYRTPDNTGYYIQFRPKTSSSEPGETLKNSSSSETGDAHNSISMDEILLFPEDTKTSEIPSLLDTETYYIVDPGKTKTSCDPGPFVVCRVIIVASPDERHWGGSAFEKDDDKALGGDIRYFPAWSLPELEAASTQLSGVQFQEGDVLELHSVFGGIPRQVSEPNRKDRNTMSLKRKVETIPEGKLRDMITGQINRHAGFGVDQPGGGVVEFKPTEDYKDVELKLASSSILQWVRQRFVDSIWIAMATYPSPMSWQLLEDYVRHALQEDNQYCVRACVGRAHASYNQFQYLRLGQCTGMVLQKDCTQAVINGLDMTVFYSSDKHHQLYDMIYKTGTIFHAFQVTKGKSHESKQYQINALVQRLQIGSGGRELRLYYAVHNGNFDSFVTNPVEPNVTHGVSIYHLKVVQGLSS